MHNNSWIRRINIINLYILSKIMYRLNEIPVKKPKNALPRSRKKYLKIHMKAPEIPTKAIFQR